MTGKESSRSKNRGASTRMEPRLNGRNLGSYNNETSPQRNIKALLYDAEGLRVDPPLSKPQDPLSSNKVWGMNREHGFCRSDVQGR